jgi:hypothetical protein
MKKLLLILGGLLITSTFAHAQSYTDVIWSQIQDAWDDASSDGYSMKNYIIGAIDEDEDNTWTFYLNSSYEYSFEGFCDEDCDDLDLYLYDEDGELLDSDTLEDDFPIIQFSPQRTGRYKIEISMFSCSVEPCYWGLAIFQQ